MIPVIADRYSYSKLTLMDSHPSDRAPQQARSAQFNLFPLPSIPRADPVPRLECTTLFPTRRFTLLARPVLGHTVKELPSRGLKSRSGGLHLCSTAIDIPSLGRPRSWRPAKLGARTTPRQPILWKIFCFFGEGETRGQTSVNWE
jgi:hypothetical protein